MLTIVTILDMALSLAFYIILLQVILSWLIGFNVINRHQPLVYQLWTGLHRLTEPVYRPIRRVLPDTGGLDLSPLIVVFVIFALQKVIYINLLPMAYGP